MRIGVFTNYHLEQFGGAEEALDRLATLWHQAGHDVVLFSAPPRKDCQRRDWRPSYRHVPMPRPFSTRFGLWRYASYLKREHRRAKLDIVSASDAYWAGHVVRGFSRSSGVPYVSYSHGSDCMDGSRFLRRPVCRRRIQNVIRDADGLACISSYIESRLRSLASPQGLVHRIINGWPDAWSDQSAPARCVHGPYFFAIGRVVQRKGFQVLIDAYAKLRATHPQLHLIVAGDGPAREELIRQAQSLGLPTSAALPDSQTPPSVCLPGFVQGEEKRSLVHHATLGVCPSICQESQGIVLLEMLCQGVPVVASNVGGIPDVIQPGVNGELFTAGDSSQLAASLDHLLGDEAKLRAMSQRAPLSVDGLRWSRVAERHLELFQAVIQRRCVSHPTARAA